VPIPFDHELQLLAVEVQDEAVQRKLATEFLLQDLAVSHRLPKDHLRRSGCLPHLASADSYVDQPLELAEGADLSLSHGASLFLALSRISPLSRRAAEGSWQRGWG